MIALRRARRRIDALGLRVTPDQLYYETCRSVLPLHRAPGRPGFLTPRPVRRAAFDRALVDTAALVTARVPVLAGASEAADILDYGLPRLLICQHDTVAAMLLANDLHMECATAVLGGSQVVDGVPGPLTEALSAVSGVVHLLHDATPAGLAWRAAVQDRVPARSLGLSPAQARSLHLHRAPGGGAEIAAVPPAHLLRVLRRLLAGRVHRPTPPLWERAGLGFLSWPDA